MRSAILFTLLGVLTLVMAISLFHDHMVGAGLLGLSVTALWAYTAWKRWRKVP